MEHPIIGWWSAGVTSAVAIKLAIDTFGAENVQPIYFAIDTAHEDNARFKAECEEWYGREIEVVRSADYRDQFDVIRRTRYVNGPAGARCTLELKKGVRQRIEAEREYSGQIFGFEYAKREVNRAIRFTEQYPAAKPLFPLIDAKMDKKASLYFLEKEGIERPAMYKLGFKNNNCIGCVKGGKGYWNKIRTEFPETFEEMAAVEREVGRSCITDTFLDELDPTAGHAQREVMPDCGNFCDLELADMEHPELLEVWENPDILRQKLDFAA